MTVSLTMIVRNENANLRSCIDLVRDVVDEIVVVDTGSTDDTAEIARASGARVVDFPWCDDFSAARNAAIEHATSSWIFVLDADDRVVPSEKKKLLRLFTSLRDENVGYVMGHVCLAADRSVSTEVNQVRLFRRRPDLRWSYRVHEQVVPAIEKAGGAFRQTGIRIVHLGFREETTVASKLRRNLRLAELDCRDRPFDPLPMVYRGAILAELGHPEEAAVSLSTALPLLDEASEIWRGGAVMLARALNDCGEPDDALRTAKRAARAHPGDVVVACTFAELLIERGDVAAAGAALAGAIDDRSELMAPDVRARALLAEVYLALGLVVAAEGMATTVTRMRPAYGRAWLTLADALLAGGRREALDDLRSRWTAMPGGTSGCVALDAARSALAGRMDQALALVDRSDDAMLRALDVRLRGLAPGGASRVPLVSCLFWPWTRLRGTTLCA